MANGVDPKYWITGLGKSNGALVCDRSARTISISPGVFTDSILTRFNLTDTTFVMTPLAPGTHFSADDCPMSKEEMDEIAMRPYRGLVGALV